MNKTVLLTILGVAVVISLVAFLPDEQTTKMTLEEETKTAYLTACKEDNDAFDLYCECSYIKLEKELGYKGIIDLALEGYENEEFTDEELDKIMDIVEPCFDLVE